MDTFFREDLSHQESSFDSSLITSGVHDSDAFQPATHTKAPSTRLQPQSVQKPGKSRLYIENVDQSPKRNKPTQCQNKINEFLQK